ncbi:DUF1214 domain-containing protein [Kitasatospora phosalacinea]|uniref:DUF1214 domain-containing protein n=1 Tax=Kitasatospora phosalacinea TaxID=2065 RepID=UPI0035DC9417
MITTQRNHRLRDRAGHRTDPLGEDGSLTLHAGARPPADPADRGNWLPAPEGRFSLFLRAYWPHPDALDGTWQPPAVTRGT